MRAGRDLVYRWIVGVGTLVLRLLDVRRTVRGIESFPREGGVVLAMSHFSYLDFVLVEWAIWKHRRRYTRFMATKKSFEHKIAGPLMSSMGHIPVDRSKGASAYRFAYDTLARGEIVGVFPETRVSASFTLLPFKKGAVRMAAVSGAPLVPCVIWGSHRIKTRTHKTPLNKARHVPVTILFGEPMQVPADADLDAVTAHLRTVMTDLLTQAQDEYPEQAEPGAWWQPAHRGGGAPTEQVAAQQDQRMGLA